MVISDIEKLFLIFAAAELRRPPLLENYVCCFNTLPQKKLSQSCYKES